MVEAQNSGAQTSNAATEVIVSEYIMKPHWIFNVKDALGQHTCSNQSFYFGDWYSGPRYCNCLHKWHNQVNWKKKILPVSLKKNDSIFSALQTLTGPCQVIGYEKMNSVGSG